MLTLVGGRAAGPATKALKQKFSVPGKEGWETNQQIAQRYHGTGGNSSPLVPVVTLPPGQTVDSPSVRGDLAQLERSARQALPGSARLRLRRRPATRRSSRRTAARRS